MVSQLTREFIQSTHPNARNGGLIALAAVALGASTSAAATTTTAAATTATTTTSTATTTPTPTPTPTATGAGGNHLHSAAESSLQQSSLAAASATTAPLVLLLPPILSCLADVDAKVRYYACEAAYNVIKVGRRVALVFFNELLDSLAKVTNIHTIFSIKFRFLFTTSIYLFSWLLIRNLRLEMAQNCWID